MQHLKSIGKREFIQHTRMNYSPRELYRKIIQVEQIKMVDTCVEDWFNSIELNWADNKDTADRLITAFAKE